MRIPVLFADDFTPAAILWEGDTGTFRRLDNGQRGELDELVRAFCTDLVKANYDDPEDEINDDYIEEAVRWTDAWWCGDERVGQEARRLTERMERGYR